MFESISTGHMIYPFTHGQPGQSLASPSGSLWLAVPISPAVQLYGLTVIVGLPSAYVKDEKVCNLADEHLE